MKNFITTLLLVVISTASFSQIIKEGYTVKYTTPFYIEHKKEITVDTIHRGEEIKISMYSDYKDFLTDVFTFRVKGKKGVGFTYPGNLGISFDDLVEMVGSGVSMTFSPYDSIEFFSKQDRHNLNPDKTYIIIVKDVAHEFYYVDVIEKTFMGWVKFNKSGYIKREVLNNELSQRSGVKVVDNKVYRVSMKPYENPLLY